MPICPLIWFCTVEIVNEYLFKCHCLLSIESCHRFGNSSEIKIDIKVEGIEIFITLFVYLITFANKLFAMLLSLSKFLKINSLNLKWNLSAKKNTPLFLTIIKYFDWGFKNNWFCFYFLVENIQWRCDWGVKMNYINWQDDCLAMFS